MDLEVGGREVKPAGSNVRAVLETRNFLLCMCREAEPHLSCAQMTSRSRLWRLVQVPEFR